MTIPIPQKTSGNKLKDFYPLQKEELIKLREVKLINNTAYVHLALRSENPFCDRSIQIVPREFAQRWKIPESSLYKAIAKLKKLLVVSIESGKLLIDWVKSKNWLRVSRRIETKYLSIGSKSSIREGQNLILTSFFSIFYLFPFSRQDKSRLLETKTQTAYINRKLILTEVPKIDHCVGQTFQGIMQLTNSFKTEQ